MCNQKLSMVINQAVSIDLNQLSVIYNWVRIEYLDIETMKSRKQYKDVLPG